MKTILAFLCAGASLWGAGSYRSVVVAGDAPPAMRSAAVLLARKLALQESAIRTSGDGASLTLRLAPASMKIRDDGYRIEFSGAGATIYGARPRSLLYAAGDFALWKTRASGVYVREPSFAVRTVQYDGSRPVAEFVAETGANLLIGKPNDAVVTLQETLPEVYAAMSSPRRAFPSGTARLVKEGHDADVPVYAFLYGNDITLWSNAIYQAVLKVYPQAKGTPAKASWEKAWLCPSEDATWKVVDAYIRDFMTQSNADGLYATFWDRYGIHCQCDRCQKNGLNQFPNQLHRCVKQYHDTLAAMNKKLVVRTWSSGIPHWLRDEYVHAPGYDHLGGSGEWLWGRVIKELPRDIVIQTKVYHSDCQPDSRFSPLVGKARPHTEIAEYQISGQTVGRFYFPASSVDYNAWTMRKARELIGEGAGVNVFPGGTRQSDYSLLDDIANSINLYSWRQLTWDLNADVAEIWRNWATPIYGERAAPHIIQALRLSEEAVNRTFSAVGMGSSTNSDFAQNIARRETLLTYTNRYYLPEYAKYLEPTRENIDRVVNEKLECLRKIDDMFAALEKARPGITPAQYTELKTRFDWLREFAIVSRHLDEGLWRYRYLRHQAAMLTTDPAQLKALEASLEEVEKHAKLLFRYDAQTKFSCYRVPLGELRTKPALGSPIPLMQELYNESKKLVESIAGPDFVTSK